MVISDYMHDGHASTAQLKTAIAADGSLGHLRQGWLDRGPGGGGIIQDHMLPHVFVVDALEGKAVEESLASAHTFAASGTSNVDTFFPVAGVDAVDLVSLKEDLTLVPWSQVAESNGKRFFDDASNPARTPLSSFRLFSVQPTLAIRFTERNRQVLFASHAEVYPNEDTRLKEAGAQWASAAEVFRCVTASAVCPAAILGSWTQLEGFANRLGGSNYQYHPNAMIDLRLTKPHTSIDPKIADLFLRYIALEGEVRDVLRIGLDRLALALRENVLTDRAIDLGIALEAMLLHNTGEGDSRGELKYRAAIRGATFLGGSREERFRRFNLLKDAYDLRSAAVHSGRLEANKIRKTLPADILSSAAATCAAVARALIERGAFPHWEREYVVGND
jgi:hypothetical protein